MTKVISLSDDAYAELGKLKKEGDSFSDVVLELTKKEKKPLSYFFGKWSDKESLDWLEKSIEKTRKETKMRDVEF
ncbi:MAG: antitoxin VapB family protein [Candidatus Aenigmatarchaeota archaeon]